MARVFVWLDGLRSLLATGRLAVWLEMGGFAWKSFWHTGAFPATPLVCALIWMVGYTAYMLHFDVVSGRYGDVTPMHTIAVLP